MSESLPSHKRPLSSSIIPLTIVAFAMLEGIAMLMLVPTDDPLFYEPPILVYLIEVTSILTQLATGILVALRMPIGRQIYAAAMPVLIVVSAVSAWFVMSQSPLAPSNQAMVIALSAIFNAAIYGTIVFFLFRPVMSRWLLSDDYEIQSRVSTDDVPHQLLRLVNSLPGRVIFIFTLALVLVLFFGAVRRPMI